MEVANLHIDIHNCKFIPFSLILKKSIITEFRDKCIFFVIRKIYTVFHYTRIINVIGFLILITNY